MARRVRDARPVTTVHVRPATLADADRLSRLGAATFRETFARDNDPEDMARYLAETFTPARQAAEIGDPAGTVLLAEHRGADGDAAELVGYAHLASGPAPASVRGPAPVELKRLYVTRAWHGRGVAQRLMDAALDAARARGAGTMWLGVWERNPRAVAFYARYGFARVGEHTFLLGADAQTDWLLARALDDPSPDATPPSRGEPASDADPSSMQRVVVGHANPAIVDCEARLRAAQLAADVAALDALIAPDLLFTGPDGELATKAQDLEAHASGVVRFLEHHPEVLHVRAVSPTVELASLRARLVVEVAGQVVRGTFRYTRVWSRADGETWRVVGGHVAPVGAA